MKIEEAKAILSALCKDEMNRSDPGVTEALEMATKNKELADWFADLLEAEEPDACAGPNVKRRVILGSAVVVGCLVIAMVAWQKVGPSSRINLAEFQNDMLSEIDRVKAIDHASSVPESIATYFDSKNIDPGIAVPKSIAEGELTGCKIISWKGHRVSLICYHDTSAGKMPGIHLVTVDASVFRHLSEGEESQMVANDWTTTAWRSGDRVFMVAVKGAPAIGNPRELVPFG